MPRVEWCPRKLETGNKETRTSDKEKLTMKLQMLSLLLVFSFAFVPALAAGDSSAVNKSPAAVTSSDPLEEILIRLRAIADKIPTAEPRAKHLWTCIVNLDKAIYGPYSTKLHTDLEKLAECIRYYSFEDGEVFSCRAMTLYSLDFEIENVAQDPYIFSYDMNVLADNYEGEGDLASADAIMDKAVELDKKGGKAGEYCLVRDLLRSAKFKRQKFDHEAANDRIAKAIEAHTKLYGPHPKEQDLFLSASKSKDETPYKFDTAIVQFERLTKSDAQNLDPADPHAGLDLYQLADAYFTLDQSDRAHLLWKQAFIIEDIALTEKVRGKGHSSTIRNLGNLADAFATAGDLKRAETIMIAASKIEEGKHPETFMYGQLRLARFYLKAKKFQESQDLYQDVLRKYSAAESQKSLKLSTKAWTELAAAFAQDNKVKLAQDTYEDGIAFFTKRKDDLSLREILASYADFNRSNGNVDEAEKLRARAAAVLGNK